MRSPWQEKKPSVPERLETVILICACGCMFHREGQWGREIVRDEKDGWGEGTD